MRYIILVFFLSVKMAALGQDKLKYNYLIATFEMKYDKPNDYYYFIIVPQKNGDTTDPVYSLLRYDNKRKGINREAGYFYNHSDTSSRLYNYFLSPSEGLNYMASIGWKAWGVYPEISSGSTSERSGENLVPITSVASKPVFCFKKD